jgi:hypothetical protein
MYNYEGTRRIQRKIWNKTFEVESDLLNKQANQLAEDKKLARLSYNVFKKIQKYDSDWIKMNSYVDDQGDDFYAYQQIEVKLLEFPLYLIPFIKYSIEYKTEAEILEVWKNQVYFVLDEVEDNDVISDEETTVRMKIDSYIKIDAEEQVEMRVLVLLDNSLIIQ